MAIETSQFKTRTPMENLSLRLINDKTDFVADRIFTPVYTDEKDIFQVYQYDARHMRNISSLSTSKAEANRVDYGVFRRDRTSSIYKLKADVDPRDAATFDSAVADVRVDAADTIWSHLMIEREVLATTLATTAANYPAALTRTLVDGTSTFTAAGGNVESEVALAHAAVRTSCGKSPNAACISKTGFDRIKAAPSVVERLKYTNGTKATEEQVANLLGVQELIIAGAAQNTAAENAAGVLADIWPDDILFFVKNPSPSKRQMRYGAWYVRNEIWTHEAVDNRRGSGDGRISELEMGWEYVLAPGAVVSASDDDFIAGYLLKNIIG